MAQLASGYFIEPGTAADDKTGVQHRDPDPIDTRKR